MITIELTENEFEKLEEILCNYQDEGPSCCGEGWKSKEAKELEDKILAQRDN